MEDIIKKKAYAAWLAGYKVTKLGEVISPRGRNRKLRNNRGYLTFSFSYEGRSVPLAVHKLVAAQKYEEAYWSDALAVARHLNGNSLDNCWSNIVIGTQSENMLDKLPEARVAHAIKAASSLRKFNDQQMKEIRDLYFNQGLSYNELSERLKISKSTLSYYLSETARRKASF